MHSLAPSRQRMLRHCWPWGHHKNVAGAYLTTDGNAVHFPSKSDHFPDRQTNVVSLFESMGAYNAVQQSDVHSYWEFNYLGHQLDPPPVRAALYGRVSR